MLVSPAQAAYCPAFSMSATRCGGWLTLHRHSEHQSSAVLGSTGSPCCCHVSAATSNTHHLACQVSRKELERVQKHKGRLQELLLRVVSLKQVGRQP